MIAVVDREVGFGEARRLGVVETTNLQRRFDVGIVAARQEGRAQGAQQIGDVVGVETTPAAAPLPVAVQVGVDPGYWFLIAWSGPIATLALLSTSMRCAAIQPRPPNWE